MLLGEFRHSFDAKGRVFLPARWREELAEGVVVTRGLDGCLYLMGRERFGELSERLDRLPSTRRDNRDYGRALFGGAAVEEIDRQGRIAVPQHLRDFARLSKEVVLVGVSQRAEIWDRAKWAEYQAEVEPRYEEIAEKLDL